MDFHQYQPNGKFDEIFGTNGEPREAAIPLIEQIHALAPGELHCLQHACEKALFQMGITFAHQSGREQSESASAAEREQIFPFDIIPRIITAEEWRTLEAGLCQRIMALNYFIDDIYHKQKILKNDVIPRALIQSTANYRRLCHDVSPKHQHWITIAGIDIVRDNHGSFFVLEDNLRCPSGVSYVLENRQVMKRTFASAFQTMNVRPVANYCDHLYEALTDSAFDSSEELNIVVLTPGQYNSAYFEHAYLAKNMGVYLVEGRDLCVINNQVMCKTTRGLERVHVIYSRIDDDFLDPTAFRSDSQLGVPGLFSALKAKQVAIVNMPGTGVADDKAVYAYVPKMIEYYLGEKPILDNVHTYLCQDPHDRQYVIRHIDKLVIKKTDQSGGKGILIGSTASDTEREQVIAKIKANPRAFIAQPEIALSTVPTIENQQFSARHVDFRPFVLMKESGPYVIPGGLTRVSANDESLIVNSSQGGGSKDTWVLSDNQGNHDA